MKRTIIFLILVLLVVGAVSVAGATEISVGTVSADSAAGFAGELVTVPVRISDNSGFTNLGIALDYDREALTLVSIETMDPTQTQYLCGTLVSTNIQWDPAKDANASTNQAFSQDKTYGYVTCAHGQDVKQNGILFTATFRIKDGFSGTAEVKPVISYVRNSLMTVTGTALAGRVDTVIAGDFDGDGIVKLADVRSIYQAYSNKSELSAVQRCAADLDQDGSITLEDVKQAYHLYREK